MNYHYSPSFYAPLIFVLLALLSFCLAYAAGFVLFTLAKTPGTRLFVILGLVVVFAYAGVELFVKTHGKGLLVLMPSGCVGVVVADVRTKLRDAKSIGDMASVNGWSRTLRILMIIMLPIALVVALSAGFR